MQTTEEYVKRNISKERKNHNQKKNPSPFKTQTPLKMRHADVGLSQKRASGKLRQSHVHADADFGICHCKTLSAQMNTKECEQNCDDGKKSSIIGSEITSQNAKKDCHKIQQPAHKMDSHANEDEDSITATSQHDSEQTFVFAKTDHQAIDELTAVFAPSNAAIQEPSSDSLGYATPSSQSVVASCTRSPPRLPPASSYVEGQTRHADRLLLQGRLLFLSLLENYCEISQGRCNSSQLFVVLCAQLLKMGVSFLFLF